VLRVLSEDRKAAFRVLMLAQCFEANAVGGGYARDQFAVRVSADSLAIVTRSSACSWSWGRRPTSSRPSPGTPTST
jgi:hypothetical protein